MNWAALKKMKCPIDNCPIVENKETLTYFCNNRKNGCRFTISKPKFEEVVDSLYRKERRLPDSRDNSEELNNFGLERVSNGFTNDDESEDD